MKFEKELIHGRLIKRYKRFLADVKLDNDEIIIAHCTNSGSMATCLEENAEVYLTHHNDPKRKTQYTWEMIKINNGWIGINTSTPNKLAYEAVRDSKIKGLEGYSFVKREVKYDDSRFDVYAENEHEKCFIEVKNVSMKVGNYARFPDAKTTRGHKHLKTLIKAKKDGYRAIMLYIIQRSDINIFGPAHDIDPDYANTLKEAHLNGVEIIPIIANVTPEKIELGEIIDFQLE